MVQAFIALIYQPFLNILVGIYWFMGAFITDRPDMGVAVILFTVVLRILLLPLSLSQERSEQEKHVLQTSAKALEDTYAAQPMVFRSELKKLMQKNRRIVLAEFIDLAIQIIIALMLWRIFARGLTGEDLHYIYSWMPKVHQPFNLMFLGVYDLTHPNLFLTFAQSVLIFVLEVIDVLRMPIKVTRQDVVKYQLFLPVVSFIIFIFLPAGKKLFIITTLLFSIGFRFFRIGQEGFAKFRKKLNELSPPSVRTGGDVNHPESASHEMQGGHEGHADGAHVSGGASGAVQHPTMPQASAQVWPQGGMYPYQPNLQSPYMQHVQQYGNPHPYEMPHQPHQAPPIHTETNAVHHKDGGEHYGEKHEKKESTH